MPSSTRPDPRGVALCLASAAGFGAMAIFAKEAYAGGASIPTLLAVRFTLAAIVLWALVLPRRSLLRTPAGRAPSLLPGLALGVLYAVEATAWFFALSRIDAALAELLLYAYPALVVVGAALLGRERITRGRVRALALSTAGIVLVLAAGEMSTVDLLGVAAAVASACLYAAYTLVADTVVAGRDPLLVSAQVVTGAAICFLAYGLSTGSIDLALSAEAWVAALSLTVLSTVVPILAFLKGIQMVGVSTATIISTAEPVITVGLAMVVLGERLAPVQLVGGALVLGALAMLARGKGVASVPMAHEPAPLAPAPAPAREAREGLAVGS
ncbi:MAG: family transporter [Solirubrobacterales bacterium]|jgi:drug/metabolite transporter (DMT)-like permease|nr:family transporter [Solirubrobacterales bacterium]